ncbi:Map microtubule affinity-regulating kinase [Goodea atripinnis]|uniref:Map microtubule affinity-regulating kinase n=1 Tax=Goodea atripinnis TaxID=208336 RepID=A0ABV0MRR6_9TELE
MHRMYPSLNAASFVLIFAPSVNTAAASMWRQWKGTVLAAPPRAPGASPSAHNISSATVSDRTNFPRGGVIRSTFHAGQQRGARDQQGSAYPGGPASPSLSHGNSQARRTHGATGIFSKFTSKFVRK